METTLLEKKVKEIKMPEEMKERILAGCEENRMLSIEKERERTNMRKFSGNKRSHKLLVAAASLALCVCVTGMTALAASGQLKGFFKDKIGWNGAIVGESYEQATDEIQVSIANTDTKAGVEVLVTLVKPEMAPYRELDMIGIENYQIIDAAGNVVAEGGMEEYVEMADSFVMTIPTENIEEGAYKLVITAFTGAAKANQPLSIYGEWECEFTK